MRTGLIAFGVIFFILGLTLYLWPTQTAGATTTTIAADGTSTRTSYATFNVPWSITFSLMAIGVILFFFGLALPGARVVQREDTGATHVLDKKEKVTINGDKKRTIVREHHEQTKEK